MGKAKQIVILLILIYCAMVLEYGGIVAKVVLFHIGNVPIYSSEALICLMAMLFVM